jgi:DNA-binding NarL/FixJ family response regulator
MNPSSNIRVALTDDHQVVIEGLSAALKHFPQIEIVATATTGASMLEQLPVCRPDVLITDVVMPGMGGMELVQRVRGAFPDIRIIALSMTGEGEQIERMMPHIDAYLLKQCSIADLAMAVELVAGGETYFDASIQAERLRYRQSQQDIRDTGITPREKQIIQLMEKDLSNKEISAQLFISVRTVETHRKNILRKTGTTNLLSLLKWATKHGVL